MHYRAQGLDWVSRIGYAVSSDGVHWNRLREPVLEPIDEQESRGVEDPRVTCIEGTFYMTYTAYSSAAEGRDYLAQRQDWDFFHDGLILPMIARSRNLIDWQRIGPIVSGEDNKDHVLFPRKINGRFAALHRRRPQVWIAFSDDMLVWPDESMAPIYGPRQGSTWDNFGVGSNGVPIETEFGWLSINHGYSQDHIYHLGVVLLDLDNPTRVIHRPADPIFWPQELWELRGDVPMVVFSCANPVVDGTVYVYYGAADHVIGLATCRLDDLVNFARFG